MLAVIAGFGGTGDCPHCCGWTPGGGFAGGSWGSAADGPIDAAQQVIDFMAGKSAGDDFGEHALWVLGDALVLWAQEDLTAEEQSEIAGILTHADPQNDAAAEMFPYMIENLMEQD
jgi:hypothetical protein